MSQRVERTFYIEGQIVRCNEIGGDRLWHCECVAFQERLSRLQEGFCGHTAVALTRQLQDALSDAAPLFEGQD